MGPGVTSNDKWCWEGQGGFVVHRECLGYGAQSARKRRRRAEHVEAAASFFPCSTLTQCKVLPCTQPFPPCSISSGCSQGGSKDPSQGTLYFIKLHELLCGDTSSVMPPALPQQASATLGVVGAGAAPPRAAAPGRVVGSTWGAVTQEKTRRWLCSGGAEDG